MTSRPLPLTLTNEPNATTFTFMVVNVVNEGRTDNQKFFLGDLPKIGDAVEMVYVGDDDNGGMRFQLRTKAV